MHETQTSGTPGNDPANDILLYRSARFSSYTFTQVLSGTDIYVKISPDEPARFYLMHWSERPGGINECTAIPDVCAVRILRSLAIMPETFTGMEFANILHYLPEYFKVRRIEHGEGHQTRTTRRFYKKSSKGEIRGQEDRRSSDERQRSHNVIYVQQDIEGLQDRDRRVRQDISPGAGEERSSSTELRSNSSNDACGEYIGYFRKQPDIG